MNIVLVEDNTSLNFSITLLLKKQLYHVHTYMKAEELIERLPDEEVDLFILDINLPDMDGLELMEVLRPYFRKSEFIFISSYTDMERIGRAFDLGCADYLKKPFEVDELLLRVEKVMQRCAFSGTFEIDHGIVFHIDKRMLEVHSQPVDLTEKESRMLMILAHNRGNIVNYDTLSECIWGKSVPQNTIASVMRRLRKKIGTEMIQSVRERGYRLLLPELESQ